jgi:hypothetical protein
MREAAGLAISVDHRCDVVRRDDRRLCGGHRLDHRAARSSRADRRCGVPRASAWAPPRRPARHRRLALSQHRPAAGAAAWWQLRTEQALRRDMVRHQLGLSLRWYASRGVGDLLSVSGNDTKQSTGLLAPLPFAIGSCSC